MADKPVTLQLFGRDTGAKPPTLLGQGSRSATGEEDIFLPAGYLVPTASFDVTPAARDSAQGATAHARSAAAGEVVVLELADGSTLITSAQRLYDTLERTRPELVTEDGTVLLEKLRVEGAAPGRGFDVDARGLIEKVFLFAVGQTSSDAIINEAIDAVGDKALLGVTWAGTKALMAAIESRLKQQPGLYRWVGATGKADDLVSVNLKDSAAPGPDKPLLVFIHGTASSTLGSFGDLRNSDRDVWAALAARYDDRIYALEHRTLSESPIDNALALARALPAGARIDIVSHSRGGLVADLLCLGDFDKRIDDYVYAFKGTGDADPDEAKRVKGELKEAHAAQREQLRELARELRERRLTVRRYVRTASPAAGTLLASGNFDLFLSSLLSLIGAVPFFFGSPVYAAFKRVVIEIAKNRTNAHLVPGIEAMLPDSPLARLLRDAPVREGLEMAVIAGDIQGGNLLRRLGVLLTDFLFFDNTDNDLVVNTTSMLAGIAPTAGARVLFDRGADVSHFRYFGNIDTRTALRDWLIVPEPLAIERFKPLPGPGEFERALAAATARGRDAGAPDRPIVVVLPGVMGSHLVAGSKKKRVWFDPVGLALGGLADVAWGKPSVEAGELFSKFYGEVCADLAASHRVEPFPYDWRQPLDVLAERLGEFLDRLMKQTTQPIRLLAHSMGGLVVRACIYKRRPVMDALMARDGARLVMLGTPNQGAHSMVENLLGKGDTLRKLVTLDLKHDLQQVLDIVAGFRGALQLLPKPGFVDTFQGMPGGGTKRDYQTDETWTGLKEQVTDLWFGDKCCATPTKDVLDAASWLWKQDEQDGKQPPALPDDYAAKSVYVFGVAPNTPCGLRVDDNGRLKMVGTTRGDGTVSWESGRIGGIGAFFYMPVAHGDLPSTAEHFPALVDLLTAGTTSRLSQQPPATRAIAQATPVSYDAGPPSADDPDALQRALLGSSPHNRVAPRPKRRLEVSVKAMDLRFVTQPIMVGHYERDPIAGTEALIDRELLEGDLSERYSLGLYAGALGTATVVLRVPNDDERKRGSLTGAVVTGLGSYDRALSPSDLTEAVRTGVLRYLLQVVDVLGKDDRQVRLATLLLGFNSSANLAVATSVEALLRGVMEANALFFETTRLNISVARLDIVELYLDTAISAVYALRRLGAQLAPQAALRGTLLICREALDKQRDGMRQRLFDERGTNYWPRMIITDADRSADERGADRRRPPPCPDPAASAVQSTPTTPPGASAAAASARWATAQGAAPIADRLRFTYVGQRARAESIALQRQPGLVEQLVAQQIKTPTWNPDLGRMLFQVMVPHDFKDAARQLARVVLVVDAYTANLPWELMLADDPARPNEANLPLALRTAVVRQLASSKFRVQVRQGVERLALVIGNPSVAGFSAAFPLIDGQPSGEPQPLDGAQREADGIVEVLGGMAYTVAKAIGSGVGACEVLTLLYKRPWRIVHIAAHGVFDLPHRDGRPRSGVLLSDGLLITAAEIASMETVPELVFLNCCHLGQVEAGRGGNKLAASVAGELIDIGVRCVVVAGWAVNDESARLFGQVFYEKLLRDRLPFGDAVFKAREAVWNKYPADITWGAFQAYGDPAWRAEPRAGGDGPGADDLCASPDEVLDELAHIRVELSRRREKIGAQQAQTCGDAIDTLIKQRMPSGWHDLPQLRFALGITWFELGELKKAREELLESIRAVDLIGVVPIRAIERLVNVEAKLGEEMAEKVIDDGKAKTSDEALTAARDMHEGALRRLDGLDQLAGAAAQAAPAEAAAPAAPTNPTEPSPHSERAALRGSVLKRMASVQARRVLSEGITPQQKDQARQEMTEFLKESVAEYKRAEGVLGSNSFSPYHALNRLALDALTEWTGGNPALTAAVEVARQCAIHARRSFEIEPEVWAAVWPAEAELVETLLDESFGNAGDAGQAVFDRVAQRYAEAMKHIVVKPTQIDSIVSQLDMLSRFFDALSTSAQENGPTRALIATRLIDLARFLQPGRRPRTDRPGAAPAPEPAPAPPPPPPPAKKAAARKAVTKKAAVKKAKPGPR